MHVDWVVFLFLVLQCRYEGKNPSNQCNQPDRRHWVVAAQNAVANATKHPELHGGVAARDPGPYYIPLCEEEYKTSGCPANATRWSPANMIYHWNQNAYTYWHMGRLGGEGMLSLLQQDAAATPAGHPHNDPQ